MAVNHVLDGRTLIIKFQDGLKENGDPKYINKSIKYLAPHLTYDVIYEAASKLAKLSQYDKAHIYVDEDYVLDPMEA